MSKTLRETKHLIAEINVLKLTESDAEVTFVGRSNSGKSSLINALCERKALAHVSQVPGKTRTINVYEVKPHRWIVDLPGYGFAVGLKSGKADHFGPMVEGYLTGRKNLRMVFVILDAFVGPTKLDMSMIDWLKYKACPLTIIVNKIDKVGSKLDARKTEISSQLGMEAADIYWISSKKKIQIEPLQTLVAELLDV